MFLAILISNFEKSGQTILTKKKSLIIYSFEIHDLNKKKRLNAQNSAKNSDKIGATGQTGGGRDKGANLEDSAIDLLK